MYEELDLKLFSFNLTSIMNSISVSQSQLKLSHELDLNFKLSHGLDLNFELSRVHDFKFLSLNLNLKLSHELDLNFSISVSISK